MSTQTTIHGLDAAAALLTDALDQRPDWPPVSVTVGVSPSRQLRVGVQVTNATADESRRVGAVHELSELLADPRDHEPTPERYGRAGTYDGIQIVVYTLTGGAR